MSEDTIDEMGQGRVLEVPDYKKMNIQGAWQYGQ